MKKKVNSFVFSTSNIHIELMMATIVLAFLTLMNPFSTGDTCLFPVVIKIFLNC